MVIMIHLHSIHDDMSSLLIPACGCFTRGRSSRGSLCTVHRLVERGRFHMITMELKVMLFVLKEGVD